MRREARGSRRPRTRLGLRGWAPCSRPGPPGHPRQPPRRGSRAPGWGLWGGRCPFGLAGPGRMRQPRQEGGSEVLIEFHQSRLSPGVIFFLIHPSWLLAAPAAQPGSSRHIPRLGSVYTGKAFLGGSPPRSAGPAGRAGRGAGKGKVGRSPFWLLLLHFPACTAPLQGASSPKDPSAGGYSSWHGPPLMQGCRRPAPSQGYGPVREMDLLGRKASAWP